MEAEVADDGQGGAAVEVGDEAGGQGRLAGVGAELGEGCGLAVDPPGRGHEEEPDGGRLGGGGLEGEGDGQVGEGEGGAVARMGVEAEAGGARDLEAETGGRAGRESPGEPWLW